MPQGKQNELWSTKVRKEVDDIIEKIKHLPFITKMMDGTLSLEHFGKYIGQDIFYCEEYSISLKILSQRLLSLSEGYQKTFEKFSNSCLKVVNILKEDYFIKFNLKEEKEMSKICEKYVNFERNNAENGSIAEGLAACLACYWVYDEIGRYMYANQTKGENIYKIWMDDYSGGPSKSLEKYLQICNEISEKDENIKDQMTKIYKEAVQMEYDFWEDACK